MTALLLVLALESTALDRAVALVESEQFDQALSELKDADREDERYRGTRDLAIRGVARDRQRTAGYHAALDFLEEHLESRATLDHFAETCIWAGEERRGLDTLRGLPEGLQRSAANAEMQLHWVRLDFANMERVARESGWTDWAAYARKEGDLRDRFGSRTTRAWWTVLIAALVLAAGSVAFSRWIARAG